MKNLLLIAAALALTAGTAAANERYNADSGLPLIEMTDGEVLNIEQTNRAGDPLMATIVVDGHQYAVYGLLEYTSAGPIYAVKMN